MNKQSRILYICTAILALTLLLSGSLPAQTSSKDACLGCHGPLEKLNAATAGYEMQSGDEKIKTSPHLYVPHHVKDSSVPRKSADIVECTNCHKPHPVPLTSKEGLAKAEAKWCYGCHHAGVLQCGTCH